jgi:hypothetical protein
MTLQFNGSARIPGPLGRFLGGVGGRVPGPIGRTLWDKQTPSPTPGAVAKTVKRTTMPPPRQGRRRQKRSCGHLSSLQLLQEGPSLRRGQAGTWYSQLPGRRGARSASLHPGGERRHPTHGVREGGQCIDRPVRPAASDSERPAAWHHHQFGQILHRPDRRRLNRCELYTDDHDSRWSPLSIYGIRAISLSGRPSSKRRLPSNSGATKTLTPSSSAPMTSGRKSPASSPA